MSKNPLRRLRAVVAAGLVIAGSVDGAASGRQPSRPVRLRTQPIRIPCPAPTSRRPLPSPRPPSFRRAASWTPWESASISPRATAPTRTSRRSRVPCWNSASITSGTASAGRRASTSSSTGRGSRRWPRSRVARAPNDRLNQTLRNVEQWRPALSGIGGPNEYETTVSDWVHQAAGLPEPDLLEGQRQRDAEGCPGSRPVAADGHERAPAGRPQPVVGRRRRPRLPLRTPAGRPGGRLSARSQRSRLARIPSSSPRPECPTQTEPCVRSIQPGVLRAGSGHLHAPARHGVLPTGCETDVPLRTPERGQRRRADGRRTGTSACSARTSRPSRPTTP